MLLLDPSQNLQTRNDVNGLTSHARDIVTLNTNRVPDKRARTTRYHRSSLMPADN